MLPGSRCSSYLILSETAASSAEISSSIESIDAQIEQLDNPIARSCDSIQAVNGVIGEFDRSVESQTAAFSEIEKRIGGAADGPGEIPWSALELSTGGREILGSVSFTLGAGMSNRGRVRPSSDSADHLPEKPSVDARIIAEFGVKGGGENTAASHKNGSPFETAEHPHIFAD